MSERAQQDKESVVEAVVSGDGHQLCRSLLRLAESCPGSFLYYTSQLIKTEQPKHFPSMGIGVYVDTPPFYYEDGVVYGATYTQGGLFTKDAHRSGAGIAHDAVAATVAKVRACHDEVVLKKILDLKKSVAELNELLYGHSSVDRSLVALAHTDLLKGQALLVAAVSPSLE